MSALEQRTLEWIEPYWNAHHLVRTRDWVLALEPEAGEALRLAALTHDIERHFPGGPPVDPGRWAPDDPGYLRLHSERSAQIVGEWLRGQRAAEELSAAVEELVRLHEVGGSPEADVLQAADSIAFLEVNPDVVLRWIREGLCGAERARAQHRWMLERIRIPRARALALPHYELARAALELEVAGERRAWRRAAG